MSLQKTLSHRKAASSFINEDNDHDLIQLSPHKECCHLEQRSLNTMTSNQESKTNFIADRILAPEKTRALVFTKTGEKHLLDLDAAPLTNKSSSNLFNLHSPRFSTPTMERISEKSSSQLSVTDTSSKSSRKLNNKLKHKHHVRQRQRLVFTPRHMKTISCTQLLAIAPLKDTSNLKQMSIGETQTEYVPSVSSSSYIPTQFKTTNTATGRLQYIPMEGPSKYFTEARNNPQRLYGLPTKPPPLKPLTIYTKYNPTLRKYTELRSLASALTMLTVVYWLFSILFDVECLWDYLAGLWQYFLNSFLTKEKPKTKVEILFTFLQDLWS